MNHPPKALELWIARRPGIPPGLLAIRLCCFVIAPYVFFQRFISTRAALERDSLVSLLASFCLVVFFDGSPGCTRPTTGLVWTWFSPSARPQKRHVPTAVLRQCQQSIVRLRANVPTCHRSIHGACPTGRRRPADRRTRRG